MAIFKCEHIGKRIRIYICGKRIASIHVNKTEYDCRYAKKIKMLKKEYGKRKIRVGFLVSEEAKWQYQSLYEELEQNANFEPIVLVTRLTGNPAHYKSISSCKAFFDNLGLRSALVFDEATETYMPLNQFGVDIVFYQQPWAIDPCQHPSDVSRYALTCYVAYGMHIVTFGGSYSRTFHKLLWNMFIENELVKNSFESYFKENITNCSYVDYSKLDAYRVEPPLLHREKKLIIYAPHHSFEKGGLACATFSKNGRGILALAQKYQDKIEWIFKPHPRFKHAIIANGIMTQQEVEEYYRAWAELGSVYDSGNYIGLFKASSGLITDCVSFRGEYLPSGHPVFQLQSDNNPFNEFGKKITETYYTANNAEELESLFHRVVILEDDYKKEERLAMIPMVFDKSKSSGEKIIELLIGSLS